MDNLLLDTVWKKYWREYYEKKKKGVNHNKLYILDMVAKQALGKSPAYKIKEEDRLNIKILYLFFCKGLLVRMNELTETIDVGDADLSYFLPFQKIKHLHIAYFSAVPGIFSQEELELEEEIYRTKLFNNFSELELITLTEYSKGGAREIDITREEVNSLLE